MQLVVNRRRPGVGSTPPSLLAGDGGHLWALPDGTGLHAPLGLVTADDATGMLCCHLCGRWFQALGAHVRVHGHTADSYREAMGLCRTVPLAAAQLSSMIRRRQQQRYASHAAVREQLAAGQALARSGQLAWRSRAANVAGAQRLQQEKARGKNLQAGRDTRAATRREALQQRVRQAGAADLAGLLRAAYANGASLDSLAASTGLGRDALRQQMRAAGIAPRSTGVNTPAGKRARALSADRAAARQLGVDDVRLWLSEQHTQGASLARLAAAVGHSPAWVRCRLNRTSVTASTGAAPSCQAATSRQARPGQQAKP